MVKEMCSILYKQFKEKVKGKVTVTPLEKGSTTIVIVFTNADETFATYIDNIVDKMYNGVDTKKVTNDILAKYKLYLLSKYIY